MLLLAVLFSDSGQQVIELEVLAALIQSSIGALTPGVDNIKNCPASPFLSHGLVLAGIDSSFFGLYRWNAGIMAIDASLVAISVSR